MIELAIACLAFLGTFIGTFYGIWKSAKLTTYRIEQLEKKVDTHNQAIDRVTSLERDMRTAYRLLETMERQLEKRSL